MVYHRAVPLLSAAAALAPLEILHAVTAAGHRLQALQAVDAGAFELVVVMPVDKARSALHREEGHIPLAAANQRVVERRHGKGGGDAAVGAAPVGVAVPADKIQLFLQHVIVKPGEILHQIGGDGHIRGQLAQQGRLVVDVVGHIPCGKAPPVQLQAQQALLAVLKRRVNLVKIIVVVAPEASPPRVVQIVDGLVLLAQPYAEALLTAGAVAVAAQLVGDVPQNQPRVVTDSLDELFNDETDFFAVDRAAGAGVVPHTLMVGHAVGLHAQNLRVLAGHPVRFGAAGGGQLGVDARCIQAVHRLAKPGEIILSLARLVLSPSKNAQRGGVHAGLFHHLDVLFQDIRPVKPLVGVVVPAAHQDGGLGDRFHR